MLHGREEEERRVRVERYNALVALSKIVGEGGRWAEIYEIVVGEPPPKKGRKRALRLSDGEREVLALSAERVRSQELRKLKTRRN